MLYITRHAILIFAETSFCLQSCSHSFQWAMGQFIIVIFFSSDVVLIYVWTLPLVSLALQPVARIPRRHRTRPTGQRMHKDRYDQSCANIWPEIFGHKPVLWAQHGWRSTKMVLRIKKCPSRSMWRCTHSLDLLQRIDILFLEQLKHFATKKLQFIVFIHVLILVTQATSACKIDTTLFSNGTTTCTLPIADLPRIVTSSMANLSWM